MRLQQSDPIFNMGVDVIRPPFNFEPKYRVIMLTREDWTKGTGTPPVVKELVWFTDGSKMKGGYQGWCLWAICGKKAQLPFRKIHYSLSGQDICYLVVCL
jgi:hypothetical protein